MSVGGWGASEGVAAACGCGRRRRGGGGAGARGGTGTGKQLWRVPGPAARGGHRRCAFSRERLEYDWRWPLLPLVWLCSRTVCQEGQDGGIDFGHVGIL